jgi:hypothetical protein
VLVALHLTPQPGEPGDSDERTARVEERFDERKRLVADGMQVLARGAMLCPACGLPISPPPRSRPKAAMTCGFCDHTGAVHQFVRGDVLDTRANEVRVVARIV